MQNSTKIIVGVVVAILIIIAVLYSKKEPKQAIGEPIKIGVILPLTGKAASQGEYARNGILLAEKELNKDKRVVEVNIQDEKGDPKETVSAFQNAMLQGVKIIIGAGSSPCTLAIAPLAEKNKILLLTPMSAAEELTGFGQYVFRNTAKVDERGKALGNYASTRFKRVAIIYDNSNPSYVSERKAFSEAFLIGGGKIVADQSFQRDTVSFQTELTKTKFTQPDAVVIYALAMPQSGLIIKQMRELGIKAQVLTTSSVAVDQKFVKEVGSLAEGLIFSGSEFLREDNPVFWDEYFKKFGSDPNMYAVQAYDSLKFIVSVTKESCPNADPVCLKDAMKKTKDYNGVAGPLSFDNNGDALKQVRIGQVKSGKFLPLINQ